MLLSTLFLLLPDFILGCAAADSVHLPIPVERPGFDPEAALQARGIDVSNVTALANSSNGFRHGTDGFASRLACLALDLIYGSEQVLRPNTSAYRSVTTNYFSTFQTTATPHCIFKPRDAESVSVSVLIARLFSCKFAVKSGGHANFAGASSISAGFVISMERFDQTIISDDRATVYVGPGATWGNVYGALDPYNRTVIGGRFASIGAGGLLLGGGLSFFSNLYGWACDNVASYEVVTASGDIRTASPTENHELYFALRGGGNNFGIVTAFQLFAYPTSAGTVWGGSRFYTEDKFASLVDAFTQLGENSRHDRRAGQWLTFVRVNNTNLAIAELYYTAPDAAGAKIFTNYTAIPSTSDGTKNWKLHDYTAKFESSDPPGYREYSYVLIVKNSVKLNIMAKDIFFEELNAVNNVITLSFQSITIPQLERMNRNGGNPLGLSPQDGTLTLIEVNCGWSDAHDDVGVFTVASRTLARIKQQAVAMDLHKDNLYMNYASQYQDVIASYGAANKQKLIRIAQQYDPHSIFQHLAPGYFKLDSAPVPGTSYFNY